MGLKIFSISLFILIPDYA